MNRVFFFYRVFDMITDVHSGSIFSLLPVNVVFVGITMYALEHVNFPQTFHFVCLLLKNPIHFIHLFLVISRSGSLGLCLWNSRYCLWINVAIPILHLCVIRQWSGFGHWIWCLWFELDRFPTANTKILYNFDNDALTEANSFERFRIDYLHSGGLWNSKQFIIFFESFSLLNCSCSIFSFLDRRVHITWFFEGSRSNRSV